MPIICKIVHNKSYKLYSFLTSDLTKKTKTGKTLNPDNVFI